MRFTKMHGLGNDFVIVDGRTGTVTLSGQQVRALADRRRGIGCDQLVVLYRSQQATCRMQIFNADGGEVAACGNATRCVAALLFAEDAASQVQIETAAGVLSAYPGNRSDSAVVDMGQAKTGWQQIPLAAACDTTAVDLGIAGLPPGRAVSVGNPHSVFFVEDLARYDLKVLGPQVEQHPLFPERTNVELVQVLSRKHAVMQVWERGVGLTEACGTGACAVVAAGVQAGLFDRTVTVSMPGGDLLITLNDQDRLRMDGPAVISFTGDVDV